MLGPLFQGAPNGIGVLSAGIILSIMVIPFIASVMRDVFEIVPPVLKESAYGIGATTWEVVWNIVLPYTKVGVIGGIMLGPRPRARRDDGGDVRHRQRATGSARRCSRPATRSPRRWPTSSTRRPSPCIARR